MEMLDYLNSYYEQYDEDGRLRSKHGLVEYLTTMRYMEKYIKKNDRILDIGAGYDGSYPSYSGRIPEKQVAYLSKEAAI